MGALDRSQHNDKGFDFNDLDEGIDKINKMPNPASSPYMNIAQKMGNMSNRGGRPDSGFDNHKSH